MNKRFKKKLTFVFAICVLIWASKGHAQESIPIYFSEYYLTINMIPKLGDTLHCNKSNGEYFKLIFYNTKGKCYCERFINNKLYEKGYYENSLDTLKRYISARVPKGKYIPIKVQKYFEPLKNGEWVVFKNGKQEKEVYLMGVLKNEPDVDFKK